MLKIKVPSREFYDDSRDEFITVNGTTLCLEHSLLSISKWEAKWHKPFMVNEPKTTEQILSYVECMTLNTSVDENVYLALTPENFKAVQDYIDDSMTATTFSDKKSRGGREVVTSELIYYWMITLGIPFECQKWHLNRLLTLIRVCNVKSQAPKKMNRREIFDRNRALNAARRKALNTAG